RAGVGIGTLYRHFPTRTDLQAAVYRSQVLGVCAAADELIVTVPPEQAFFGWVRAMAGYLATKRGLSRALIEAVGKDSELISGCWVEVRESTDRLPPHARDSLQHSLGLDRRRRPALQNVVLVPGHAVARLDRGQLLEPLRHVVGRG